MPCLNNGNYLYFQLLEATCGQAVEYCTIIAEQTVYILNLASIKGKV